MRIMNVKRAIIFLLMVGVIAVVAGCVRWPEGPEPEPGETEYQLEITVEVAGEINSDDGIYYIGLDADGNPATGPEYDISLWEGNFYYAKFDYFGCYLYPKEGSSVISLTSSIFDNGKKLRMTIALSDLGVPSDIDFSIDINVVTTDSEGNNYDHLDSYFTIYTILGSTEEGIVSEGGSEEGGADFDIVKVTAKITTLY